MSALGAFRLAWHRADLQGAMPRHLFLHFVMSCFSPVCLFNGKLTDMRLVRFVPQGCSAARNLSSLIVQFALHGIKKAPTSCPAFGRFIVSDSLFSSFLFFRAPFLFPTAHVSLSGTVFGAQAAAFACQCFRDHACSVHFYST